MAYIKGMLAGLVAVVVCALVVPNVVVLVPTIQYRPRVNPIFLAADWPMGWALAVAIFAVGFYWEFRRIAPKHR